MKSYLALGLPLLLFACVTSDEATADELKARFDKPNGSLAQTDIGLVKDRIIAVGTEKDLAEDIAPKCDALDDDPEGSCTCPGGGKYDFKQIEGFGDEYDVVDFVYSACKTERGATLNGKLLFRQSDDKATRFLAYDNLDVLRGEKTTRLDVVARYRGKDLDVAIELPSGWIRVVLTGNGNFDLTDSAGTWGCTWDGSKESCKLGERTLTE